MGPPTVDRLVHEVVEDVEPEPLEREVEEEDRLGDEPDRAGLE
jgi:hypothetical protein